MSDGTHLTPEQCRDALALLEYAVTFASPSLLGNPENAGLVDRIEPLRQVLKAGAGDPQ